MKYFKNFQNPKHKEIWSINALVIGGINLIFLDISIFLDSYLNFF